MSAVRWGLVVVLVSVSALAAPPKKTQRDLDEDRRFRDDIAKVSADAAAAWDEANAARDAERYPEAEAAYRKAIALAPKVDHLHRRLCHTLGAENRSNDALAECELAVSLAPTSATDMTALAGVLLYTKRPGDMERGIALARKAAELAPDDPHSAQIDCAARAMHINVVDVTSCVDHLLAIAPESPIGNVLAAQLALMKGDYKRASIYVERAHDGGLPDTVYGQVRSQIDGLRKQAEETFTLSLDTILAIGVPLIGGWILLLIALLVLGNHLSAVTLRNAGHLADAAGGGSPRERRIRRLYRTVLFVCGLMFYGSLPLMIASVLFGALIALAIFDAMGGIPVYILILMGGIVLSTILAVLRTLLVRRPFHIEGKRVDPASYPALKAMLDEVAATIGTRPVDVVYLNPGTEAAVTERRTVWQALRGAAGVRVLILGVGLFDGMKQGELRSILAHEYGHFRNADVGVGSALSVQGALIDLIRQMSGTRAASVFNPAFWFLRAYTHLYLVISQGASRLQELLADRWAIRAYGSAAFVAGYRHVVTREVEFKADLTQTLKDVLDNKWSLPNLYSYAPERSDTQADRDAAIAKELDRAPGQFDSHPTSRQRIEWAEQAALPADQARADASGPVWELFSDPEAIEREMTAIIRERIRTKLGVTISDAEWDDDDADETVAHDAASAPVN